jgi:hypothetical protein
MFDRSSSFTAVVRRVAPQLYWFALVALWMMAANPGPSPGQVQQPEPTSAVLSPNQVLDSQVRALKDLARQVEDLIEKMDKHAAGLKADLLQEAPPTEAVRKMRAALRDDLGKDKPMALQFRGIHTQLERLRSQLQRSTKASTRNKGGILRDMLRIIKEDDLLTRLDKVCAGMKKGTLDSVSKTVEVLEEARSVEKSLQRTMDLLLMEPRENILEREVLEVARAIKGLDGLINEQKAVQEQMQGGKGDPDELARALTNLKNRTSQLAKESFDPRMRKQLQDTIVLQQQAMDAIQNHKAGATELLGKSLLVLETARKGATQIARQFQEELDDRALGIILEHCELVLVLQRNAQEETAKWNQAARDARAGKRAPNQAGNGVLSAYQAIVIEQTANGHKVLSGEFRTRWGARVSEIADRMSIALEYLEQGDLDRAQAEQKEVLIRLTQLSDAVRERRTALRRGP